MWIRLSTQYLQDAVEDQHVLLQRFFEYKFRPEHDILAHITEIETMASALNDIGATTSPMQIMTKIVTTLLPSYRNFITAWGSVPNADKKIALLTSRLLKEESMLKRWNGEENIAKNAALLAQHPSPSSSFGQDHYHQASQRWTWTVEREESRCLQVWTSTITMQLLSQTLAHIACLQKAHPRRGDCKVGKES